MLCYQNAVATQSHDAASWISQNNQARTARDLQFAHRLRHEALLQTIAVTQAWPAQILTLPTSSLPLSLPPSISSSTALTSPSSTSTCAASSTSSGSSSSTNELPADVAAVPPVAVEWRALQSRTVGNGKRSVRICEGDAIDAALELGACLVVEKIGGHPEGKHERDGFLESHLFRRTTLGVAVHDYLAASLPAIARCYVIRSSEREGYAFLSTPLPLTVAICPAVTTDLRIKQAAGAVTSRLAALCDSQEKLVFQGLYGHGNQQTGTPPLCAALLQKAMESNNKSDSEVVIVAKNEGLQKLYSQLLCSPSSSSSPSASSSSSSSSSFVAEGAEMKEERKNVRGKKPQKKKNR